MVDLWFQLKNVVGRRFQVLALVSIEMAKLIVARSHPISFPWWARSNSCMCKILSWELSKFFNTKRAGEEMSMTFPFNHRYTIFCLTGMLCFHNGRIDLCTRKTKGKI